MAQIIEFWEKKGRESPTTEGAGRAVPGAHPKAFGVVRAEVEILGSPRSLCAGHLCRAPSAPRADSFLQRGQPPGPRRAARSRIWALRSRSSISRGRSWSKKSPAATTFDLVLKNNAFFIANTAKHYLFIQEIANDVRQVPWHGKKGFHELLTDFVTGKGTLEQEDWAWDELFTYVKAATQTPVRNPLLTTYSTMGVRHGDYVAKTASRRRRTVRSPRSSCPRPQQWTGCFRPDFGRRVAGPRFEFDLQVQLCTDLDAMPVNDLTTEWPETLSPYVTVGRVRLPASGHLWRRAFREG